ncbi:hypothetical protein ACO229_11150 [Promicromonospora sp. MS192]|uniref:hypothetical protein n=1 Tax=Promicromonospora sp. MS192 TaxID=3412684 RepID=UPI003C2BA936
MITHTMLVSFDDPISDIDLDQFLGDIEISMRDTGAVRSFSAHRHVPVAGEDAIPAFVATAVLHFGVDDRDGLAALFAAPGAVDVIHTWKTSHPYRVAWVNYEAGK